MTTPWHKVEYGDFFIADQMTSVAPFLGGLVNIGCLFFHSKSTKNEQLAFVKNILLTFILVIPYWIRLLQCIRRYYDGRVLYPHAVSGCKYLLNLSSFVTLGLTRTFKVQSIGLQVSLYSACTLYNLFWDSFYDFGLFHYGKSGPK